MRTSTRGAATREGTARFRDRFAARFTDDHYRPLGALTASSIGLGTFLGACTDDDDAQWEAAIRAGLAAGCNVIDTAINYRCQRSERDAGRALAGAIADGVVQRDEIIVCTKGGYVALDGAPPPDRAAYDAYLEREFYATGVMAPSDVALGGHSLAPGFLAHQIARSRANLGVDTIDVYYLHDPEVQRASLADGSEGDAAFRALLRGAIEALEAAVARGEIGAWGVASWRGLRTPPGAKGHLSLADVASAAREVAGNAHHLRAVQLPINLAMPEAVRAPTQTLRAGEPPVPVLQATRALGLATIASATLMQSQLAANLPDAVRDAFPGCATDAQRAITFTRSLPGVSCALVGMRTTSHLSENLRAAR